MGKWAKYEKKHKKEWEQEAAFRDWLVGSKDGTASFCTLCNIELRAHRTDLQKHSVTNKHKLNSTKCDSKQNRINNYGVPMTNNTIKKKEIIWATYIALHTSISSVDHLGELLNAMNIASTSTKINNEIYHIHRTKCSAIIREVIAPSLLQTLISDIGNSPFSILVDESTDVSTQKLLCICVKYYSKTKNDIITHFLAFIHIASASAENVFNAVVELFTSIKLNIKNLIGIGTDGANNLCGQHHSLYTLLKQNLNLENLLLIKCICHSLHLCGSKTSEVFADEVDFLLKETYNWFKNSSNRMNNYKKIYDLINTDNNNFTRLVQLSTTRWLSRYRAVDKILEQYLELETFFNISANKERCYTAKLLSDMYKNKEHKVILTFLKPILKDIYDLNIYFQKNNIDHYKAFNEVNILVWSLVRRIMRPAAIDHLQNDLNLLVNSMKNDQNYLNLNDCDLGYHFNLELETSDLADNTVVIIKSKCLEFIKVLVNELVKRMPTHLNVLETVKHFSPVVILNQLRPKFSELPLQYAPCDKLPSIESQYRNLLCMNWSEIFEGHIPEDSISFWKKVMTLKNAGGEPLFADISLLAFAVLSFPSSNAAVERVFSLMNIIKNKLRNKIMLKTLNALVLIKWHCNINNICCKDFVPTADMLERFTSDMYQQSATSNEINETTNDEFTMDNLLELL